MQQMFAKSASGPKRLKLHQPPRAAVGFPTDATSNGTQTYTAPINRSAGVCVATCPLAQNQTPRGTASPPGVALAGVLDSQRATVLLSPLPGSGRRPPTSFVLADLPAGTTAPTAFHAIGRSNS
jgi:hypothetical protein